MKKKTMLRLLAAALLLMLISCLGAYAIQMDMGNIRVMDVKIPMPQGETLRVLIHKPASATRDNPAPCIITSHGYHATLETQDITSIELARRGFVVFNMDTYSAGDSSGTVEEYGYNRSYYGLGMLQLVDYVHDNIDYIDPDRIGITGHSTGGRNVAFTLDAYGRNEHGKVYTGQPEDGSDYTTKVSSALILAFFPDRYLLSNLPSGVNVGINFARYDEGATVQVTKVDGYQWPDMTVSPEAKFFINQTAPGTFTMDTVISVDESTGKDKVELSGYDNSQKVEIGKYYGSISDGTMRVVYNPNTSHQWQFFSAKNASITNQFFMDTLGAPNPISAGNQLWFVKHCGLLPVPAALRLPVDEDSLLCRHSAGGSRAPSPPHGHEGQAGVCHQPRPAGGDSGHYGHAGILQAGLRNDLYQCRGQQQHGLLPPARAQCHRDLGAGQRPGGCGHLRSGLSDLREKAWGRSR